jgi:hypothetical protein
MVGADAFGRAGQEGVTEPPRRVLEVPALLAGDARDLGPLHVARHAQLVAQLSDETRVLGGRGPERVVEVRDLEPVGPIQEQAQERHRVRAARDGGEQRAGLGS